MLNRPSGTPETPARRWRMYAAAALLLVGVAASGILAIREVVSRPPPLEILVPAATAAPTEVTVHIAGAVANPGVYTIPNGTRLVTAIENAGGARPDADTGALNLALPVSDGVRYYVPLLEEGAGAGGGLVDINVAGVACLQTLPGIGPVTAERIIAHRQTQGPFIRIEDLLQVAGIGDTTLERLRPHVTAG